MEKLPTPVPLKRNCYFRTVTCTPLPPKRLRFNSEPPLDHDYLTTKMAQTPESILDEVIIFYFFLHKKCTPQVI